jgi:hypothetical protein
VIPFGNLLAGAVAEVFHPTVALAGGGLLSLVVVVLVAAYAPQLRILRATTVLAPGPQAAT